MTLGAGMTGCARPASSRAGWGSPSPAGGWPVQSPRTAAASGWSREPASTAWWHAGSRMATRAATCAGRSRRSPTRGWAARVLDRFFVSWGRHPQTSYRRVGMQTHAERPLLRDLTVLAAFVEVTLAREGHSGRVGINLLTKVRPPTLPTLYGAMLAGVDCILMGAGIPRENPGGLDAFAARREASLRLHDGPAPEPSPPTLTFDPARLPYGAARLPPLPPPSPPGPRGRWCGGGAPPAASRGSWS